jgi:hypothetical protein
VRVHFSATLTIFELMSDCDASSAIVTLPRAISVWHCLIFDLNNNISVVPVQTSGVGNALTQLVQIYEKLVHVYSQNVLLSSRVKRTLA